MADLHKEYISKLDYKIGDIKFYHESGEICKVKILDILPHDLVHKRMRDEKGRFKRAVDKGIEVKLEVLERDDALKKGYGIPKGQKFSVWENMEMKGKYGGWYIGDN